MHASMLHLHGLDQCLHAFGAPNLSPGFQCVNENDSWRRSRPFFSHGWSSRAIAWQGPPDAAGGVVSRAIAKAGSEGVVLDTGARGVTVHWLRSTSGHRKSRPDAFDDVDEYIHVSIPESAIEQFAVRAKGGCAGSSKDFFFSSHVDDQSARLHAREDWCFCPKCKEHKAFASPECLNNTGIHRTSVHTLIYSGIDY